MSPLFMFIPFLLVAVIWFIVVKKMKQRGKGSVIRHLLGLVLGTLGGIIAIILIAPAPQNMTEKREETTEQVSNSPQEKPTPAVESNNDEASETIPKSRPKTIGLPPKTFIKAVNKRLKSYDFPAQLPTNPAITDGEVNNIAQMFLTENLGVTLSLEKEKNEIKGVTTIMSLTGNLNANLLLFGANATIISSFAQNEEQEIGTKFFKLSTEAMGEYADSKNKLEGVQKDFIYKDMKFGIIVNEVMGIYSYAQFNE